MEHTTNAKNYDLKNNKALFRKQYMSLGDKERDRDKNVSVFNAK